MKLLIYMIVFCLVAASALACGYSMKTYEVYDVEIVLIKHPAQVMPMQLEQNTFHVWKNLDNRRYLIIDGGYLEDIVYPGDYTFR